MAASSRYWPLRPNTTASARSAATQPFGSSLGTVLAIRYRSRLTRAAGDVSSFNRASCCSSASGITDAIGNALLSFDSLIFDR